MHQKLKDLSYFAIHTLKIPFNLTIWAEIRVLLNINDCELPS
jgi:hypothetical protein